MKNTILLAIFALIMQASYAQFAKGAMTITGVVGFNGSNNLTEQTNNTTNITQTTNDQKTKGYAFVPSFGYFLTDKIELAIALAIMKNTTETDFHPTTTFPGATRYRTVENPLFAYALLANYYITMQKTYACYAGLQLGMGSGTGKTTTEFVDNTKTEVETKNNVSTFGLNGGFIYFVKANMALNANLGLLSFNRTKSESTSNDVTTKTNNGSWAFGVNGVMINIGIKYFLSTNVEAP